MPAEILKTVRLGIETTRGTGVACTRIIDFESAELEHNVPALRSPNLTGGVFASSKIIPGVEINRIKLKLGSVNWDRLHMWLLMAMDGTVTGTGATADKTWGPFKPPALSTGGAVAESLKSATVEFGYANPATATPAHKLTGCLVERLKLVWEPRNFVSAEVDLITLGTVTDITSFSGTLSPDTVTAQPDFSGFAAYVDDTTIGTTADTAIVGGELEWTSFMAVDENRKRLAIARQAQLNAKLTRFWEAADMISAYRTKATKKVRLQTTGPVLGSGTYKLTADLYGTVETRSLGSIAGFVSEELDLAPQRDSTVGSDVAITVINAQTTA